MANHQNAGNAGLYNAAGGLNGMPSAGHYSDMQTLMQNMETLSGWLQQYSDTTVRRLDTRQAYLPCLPSMENIQEIVRCSPRAQSKCAAAAYDDPTPSIVEAS
jgi:hypothetical protein